MRKCDFEEKKEGKVIGNFLSREGQKEKEIEKKE